MNDVLSVPICVIDNDLIKRERDVLLDEHIRRNDEINDANLDQISVNFKLNERNAATEIEHVESHLRTTINTDKSICDICQKAFARPGNLKRHRITHTKEGIHACKTCGKSKCQENHTENNDELGQHICDRCGKAFKHLSHLTRHIAIHAKGQPYVCGTCKKSFGRSDHLLEHIRMHSSNKLQQHKCESCLATFTLKSELNDHHRSRACANSSFRPNVCDICTVAFAKPSYLERHLRIHTGDRPFACDICSKAFADDSSLKRHKRTHTGSRPYVCVVCEKTFNRSHHLKRHMNIHTGDCPYTCDICFEEFGHPNLLVLHAAKHKVKK